ncbi:Zinc finger protein 226 [Plakobranchus ocellatus]|uniref:Zinc finger protein 226 n=1 Tax=Plakobranchus ocellatus TaxID=259542 RepID=A0AAV3YDV3_9GAST|nr:Zinc finger protein 226 [Plakobranchus ocellatus]
MVVLDRWSSWAVDTHCSVPNRNKAWRLPLPEREYTSPGNHGHCHQGQGHLQSPLLYAQSLEYYSCRLCDERFPTLFLVRQHMSDVHIEQLPYKCSLCGKGFVSYSGLRHHRQAHAGKVFSCEICGTKFKHKHHMKDHIRRLHPSAHVPSAYERHFKK